MSRRHDPWLRRFDVNGSAADPYRVALKSDGSWGCTCPRWKFAKAPKPDCKHIAEVQWALDAAHDPARMRAAGIVEVNADGIPVVRESDKEHTAA